MVYFCCGACVCAFCVWRVDVVWCGVTLLLLLLCLCACFCVMDVCAVWKVLCDVVCGVVGCFVCDAFV